MATKKKTKKVPEPPKTPATPMTPARRLAQLEKVVDDLRRRLEALEGHTRINMPGQE
jgi:hypothetical protein